MIVGLGVQTLSGGGRLAVDVWNLPFEDVRLNALASLFLSSPVSFSQGIPIIYCFFIYITAKMRLINLAVAALPMAASAYTAHPMLLKAAEQQGCSLPTEFKIRNFAGQTNGTADAPAPSCFTFNYADAVTGVETTCQLNSTSKSTTPEGLTPRFACENRDVKFIWGQANSQLTIVERACPSPQGYDKSLPKT